MNILSIPCTNGVHSHSIPLFVLNQRYFRRLSNVNSSFLLPGKFHKQYKDVGISVLPIDFSLFEGKDLEEMIHKNDKQVMYTNYDQYINKLNSAFGLSKPDIIIDDNEIFSTLIAEKKGKARMSIYRTGYFRSIDRNMRNPGHMHSMEKTSSGKGFDASIILKPNSKLSLMQRTYFKDTYFKDDIDYFMNYLNVRTKLIPGIPSIEKLPDDVKNVESYFYTGPLLIEDNPSEKLYKETVQFFDHNKNRKSVFITTGLVDQDNIQEMIIHLLRKGYAVISTRKFDTLDKYKEQFFHNSFLSLNYICSKVELIIHHCGSGMYHYPLLHQKPVITIGTQCYDREDVAIRLQQLNLSKHVPSQRDDENYMGIFIEHLEAFEKGTLCDFEKLAKIKEEIYSTMLDFDIEKAIEYTLNSMA